MTHTHTHTNVEKLSTNKWRLLKFPFFVVGFFIMLFSCAKESPTNINLTQDFSNSKEVVVANENTQETTTNSDCFDPTSASNCTYVKTVNTTVSVPGYCDVAVKYDLYECSHSGNHTSFHYVNFEWELTFPSCNSLKALWDSYVTSAGGASSLQLGLGYYAFENALRHTLSDLEIIPEVLNNRPFSDCTGSTTTAYSAEWFTASCIQLCHEDGLSWGWQNSTPCGTVCCLDKIRYCYDSTLDEVRKTSTRVQIGGVCNSFTNVSCFGGGDVVVDCHDTCDENF